ncbi:sigma 54-interacting transcriptional regulator [Thermoactinomyces mirandus]|uniref:HTH-type transcriptional regulatory protein TyrR n=1 Tax=Thermoactinomyces mirandus TaxID=2756294 RepID=A0A7W1XS63_9BACL|nr:sigma 54-interacting transcriptional regulator [Thermoactinomyces mirandus]MBA4602147.1 sigma 54-interacting transcriptional regulator [Thermoactinomyces mirandus]
METISLRLKTEDRVGITHDVISCLLPYHTDIVRMEVKPHFIHLKIGSIPSGLFKKLLAQMNGIDGVMQVELDCFLPSEVREGQMDTILKTVSEGMILLDRNLHIQAMNRAAAEMLGLSPESVKGKSFSSIWESGIKSCQGCLETGKEVLNVPVVLYRKHRTIQLMASYNPVRTGEEWKQSGLVVVIRDMKQINQLLQSAKQNGMIQFSDIIHRSEAMRKCIEAAKRVAEKDATIFLWGESGTGKELFARVIHFASRRANGPFVSVNCAAIPDALLESELFGYEPGAFTGAGKGGKKGLFEMAQDGTLFLDEIGELPLHHQAKLLRVLEERLLRRVGGNRPVPLRLRIITATNRDLKELVRRGQFREDLYYRLHVIPINIPPLRERKEDISLLSVYFIERYCTKAGRAPLVLSQQALARLEAHGWPGNVRELQNVIERSVYLCPDKETELKEIYLGVEPEPVRDHSRLSLKEHVERVEKQLVQAGLKRYKSVRKTARHLGVSHTAILNKMKKYGISKESC